MKSSSCSKMTPQSLINKKKAIESRTRHRNNATPTPGENKPPCGKKTPVTPISVTPYSTPRIRRQTPNRKVLFEINDNIVVSGNSKGINVRSKSQLNVNDPATPVLNRSRSASNIKWDGEAAAIRRSVSLADVNAQSSEVNDRGTSAPLSNVDLTGETSRITVGVRIRPLHPREYGNTLVVDGQQLRIASDLLSELAFTFDHVFVSCGENSATQHIVYESMMKPLLDNAFLGYNACLFAYGQTGSGKTYSMMGPETVVDAISETTGIIPRFCHDLFERCNAASNETGDDESHTTFTVEVSYLEVYNEKIRDLLVGDSNNSTTGGPGLRVREHPVYGPYVVDLSRHTVNSFTDIQHWLSEGNKRRAVAATEMNDCSSRSHSLFTLTLTQSTIQTSGNGIWSHERSKRSQINLVDLAGSERLAHSYSSSDRLREGVSINKSLLTLGKVISALVEKRSFVPYRESILTWLLKESLGGNSKTAMLATVSPCSSHADETVATLRYANQARAIVNTVRVNESPQDKIIRELQSEVLRLKEACSKLDSWASLIKCDKEVRSPVESSKLSAKIAAMESEWSAKVASAENESAHLTEQLRSLKDVAKNITSERDKWKTQALQYQEELSSHMGKACKEQTSLHNQLAEWREKVSTLEQELTMQQMQWGEKYDHLMDKYESQQQKYEKQISSLEDAWQKKISDTECAYQLQIGEWKNKLAEIEDFHDQHIKDLENGHKEIVSEMEKKLAEEHSQTVLQVTTAVQVQTNDVSGDVEKSPDFKRVDERRIKKEVIKLKKKLQEQLKLVSALKLKAEKYSSLYKEYEELKTELVKAQNEVTNQKLESDKLKTELAASKNNAPSMIELTDLTMARAEVSSARAELEQTKCKFELATQEVDVIKHEAMEELSEAKVQLESMKSKLEEAKSKELLYVQEIDHLKEELFKLNSELSAAKDREESLQAKLEETSSELELLRVLEQRYQEKIDSSVRMDTDSSIKIVPVLTSSFAQTDPSLHSSDQLERRVGELQKRVDQKLNLIAELEKANSRYKEETSNAMQQLSDATGRLAIAEASSRESADKLLKLQSEYESEVEQSNLLAKKIEELTIQLNEREKKMTEDLANKVDDILQRLDKSEEKAEQKGNNTLQSFELSEALAQVERKKKRIEKLKGRIDTLEELFVSAMRTGNEKKTHALIKEEHAKIYNTMMEHSYLFHWDYLLRKARTYAHKYHIPYEFESHDNVTGLVRHTLYKAKSYWFRVDFMAWFNRIEKDDRWSRSMDKDINWEIDFGSYYDIKESSPGSKCPVEDDAPEPYLGHVALCCKPDFICPETWQKSIVKRHLSGLIDDCRCLLVYLRDYNCESVIDLLKCIDNMATQLNSELHPTSDIRPIKESPSASSNT